MLRVTKSVSDQDKSIRTPNTQVGFAPSPIPPDAPALSSEKQKKTQPEQKSLPLDLNQTSPLKDNLKGAQHTLLASAQKLNGNLIDFIFPPLCLNCQAALDAPNHLCSPCWQDITFLIEPLCHIKGTPLPYDIGPFDKDNRTISADAIANPPAYDQARSIAHYDGTMRNLIHKFKYQDRHELTTLFANWLHQFGKQQLREADLLIPIPLYKWRLWQRRFNQSAELARRLGEQTGIRVDLKSFIRQKKTRAQVGLSYKERQKNVANAFSIPNERVDQIKNKRIILIDDVITTGATVNAAATKLKNSGASSVVVLSLATVTKELIESF